MAGSAGTKAVKKMDFVGYLVSLDCGDTLGTYQGTVEHVDPVTQTITLSKAYRNGLQSKISRINIT